MSDPIVLYALFTVIGGLCIFISMAMFVKYCSGSQVRTSDDLYFYVWFIGFIAVGIICSVVAALLSDKLKNLPQ